MRRFIANGARAGGGDMIRFTVRPAGERTLTLCHFVEPLDAVVDWGDGETGRIESNAPLTHVYADETERQVSIRGALGGFWHEAERPAGTDFVVSLDEIASGSLVSLRETFRQCAGLAALPGVIAAPNLTDCVRTFFRCRSVRSALPALWLTHAGAVHQDCFTQCVLSLYGHYGTACPYREYVAATAAESYYQHYGTACPAATYHAAVAAKTYYQQYGTSCPRRSYVPGVAKKTYLDRYGGSSCPNWRLQSTAGTLDHTSACSNSRFWCGAGSNTVLTGTCACGGTKMYAATCNTSGTKTCSVTYSAATSAYYRCSGGGSCAGSACPYVYQAGQSAYYSCGQAGESGASRCSSSCARVYQSGQSAYYRCAPSNATCQADDCAYAHANQDSFDAARAHGWA